MVLISRREKKVPLQPLLAIVGPTASGKSALALNVALELRGEIVNCDVMQMIRHLEIGTAKPSQAERELVPHHLYDVIEADEHYSAGQYMRAARGTCREIASRGKVPIVVGGTGLYFRVLTEGIFEGAGKADETRMRLGRIAERRGSRCLHRMLSRHDAEAAAKIQPADRLRVIRALEVYFSTGRAISDLQKQKQALSGFAILKIGLNVPRKQLYDRINRRVETMFRSGLLSEVRFLMEGGYSSSAKGFEVIGYRYGVAVLQGEMTIQEAVSLAQRDTRRYAKRQMTWFRGERNIRWLETAGEDPSATRQVISLLQGESI